MSHIATYRLAADCENTTERENRTRKLKYGERYVQSGGLAVRSDTLVLLYHISVPTYYIHQWRIVYFILETES